MKNQIGVYKMRLKYDNVLFRRNWRLKMSFFQRFTLKPGEWE